MVTSGSDLPPEMVRCIAEHADVGCRARMRAVCSLWNAEVPADLPQPWVLLQPAAAAATAADGGGEATAADRDRESDRFRVLSLPANRELTLSRAFSSGCGVPGARCVGAGHGWLALVGTDLSVTLHSPFTGRSVSLPPLFNHPMVKGGVRDDGTVLYRRQLNDDAYLEPVTPEYLRDNLVRKIVFSPAPEQDDYFAVQLFVSQYTMYARAGATQWKTLRDKDKEPFMRLYDVLHVEGSRFFAVRWSFGDVYQLDLAGSSPSFSRLAPSLYLTEGSWYYPREDIQIVDNYLVLVNGELYQVWAKWEDDLGEEDTGYVVIKEVGIVKCDLDEHTYLEVAGELDDWAVLIGANETVAVRAGDMLRGNCVYFMDGDLEKVACEFDLRTQCAEAVDCEMLRSGWPEGSWRYLKPPPVWFVPSYADATAQAGSPRPSGSSPPGPWWLLLWSRVLYFSFVFLLAFLVP